MPHYSKRSQTRLDTCHPKLVLVMNAVIKYYDISILEGARSEERQNEMFEQKLSRVQWPNSKHNCKNRNALSRAVDIDPWIPGIGIDWDNHLMFHFMAGRVLANAERLGVPLRWGGDWNRNQYSGDEKFLDLVHFELDE